jgi:hypothetical protein
MVNGLAKRGRLGIGTGRRREGEAIQRHSVLVHLEVERVAAKISVAGDEVVPREGAIPAGTRRPRRGMGTGGGRSGTAARRRTATRA